MIAVLNIILLIASLVLPAIIIFKCRGSWIWLGVAVIIFWGLMVLGGELNLAFVPEYDSFAPAVSIFGGWLFGLLYCTFLRAVVRAFRRERNIEDHIRGWKGTRRFW